MIALTQRLNERDEQIMALQDELDAYDRHQQSLEEKLDEKTAALIHLQRVTMEQQARSPVKNSDVDRALGTWARDDDPAASAETKRYAPLTTGGDESASSSSSNPALLSATEKIAELERVVADQREKIRRSERALKESKEEKASMEVLLRERLEKLVQSEIESRMAASSSKNGGDDDGDDDDGSKSKRRQDTLRDELARSEQRCATHEKERRAILTIMEQKIKTLVENASTAARAIRVSAVGGGRDVDVLRTPQGQALDRELQALHRLVNASVVALKNSMNGSEPSNRHQARPPTKQTSLSKSTPIVRQRFTRPGTSRRANAGVRSAMRMSTGGLKSARPRKSVSFYESDAPVRNRHWGDQKDDQK